MKAAVTTENQEVFQHFGKCQTFTLAVIENNQILSKSLLDAQGNGHSALVGLLQAQGVDTLVCGGIGQGAVEALSAAGIQVIRGCQGRVSMILELLAQGLLKDNPSQVCDHHDHDCKEHTC